MHRSKFITGVNSPVTPLGLLPGSADQARIEAEEAAKETETKRLADEEKVRAAEAKKAANKTHQTKILKAAKESFIEFGLEEVFAKKLALAIAKGEITNVKMEF